MSRIFVPANQRYLEGASAIPTIDFPFTISVWFKPYDTTTRGGIAGAFYSSSATAKESVQAGGSDYNSHLIYCFGANTIETTNAYIENEWNHALITTPTSSSRSVILNGDWDNYEYSTVNYDNNYWLGIMEVGRTGGSSPGNYFNGEIAEVAVWGTGLDIPQINVLAKKYSPLNARSQRLMSYIPIIGRNDPETDLINSSYHLHPYGLGGPPLPGGHPGIIYPGQQVLRTERMPLPSWRVRTG